MDKYIKALLIALSDKYDITLMTFMYYRRDQQRIATKYSLIVRNIGEKKPLAQIDLYGKRQVVLELMKWEKEK